MDEEKYLFPRLGVISAAVALLWLLALWLPLNRHAFGQFAPHDMRAFYAILGTFYGLVGVGCWMATLIDALFVRSLVRVVMAFAGGYAMTAHRYGAEALEPQVVIRQCINFGGMMACQCVLFVILGVPGWRLKRRQIGAIDRRFSIGAVLVTTTCMAILFALAIRYQAPVSPAIYWPWLATVLVVSPLISAGVCTAALSRSGLRATVAGGGAILLAVIAAIIFGQVDYAANKSNFGQWDWVSWYALVSVGSMGVFVSLAIAGGFDDRIANRTVSDDSAD